MIVKTRGIVLSQIPFKESSLILKIYTEELGTRGFIQNAAKKISKKSRSAYFLPLSLLDLVIYHKPERDLDTISEVKFMRSFETIPFDTLKSTIAIFLSEVLNQALRHEPGNSQKFDFLASSILSFDQPEAEIKDFPSIFLFQLSHYLGFGPSQFEDIAEEVAHSSDPEFFKKLMILMVEKGQKPDFSSGIERLGFLEIMLLFYQNHLENFREIKSLPILHEVLA